MCTNIHTYINIHQVVLLFYDLSSVLIQNWLPFPQCHPHRAPLSVALLHEVVPALPSSALLTLTTASFCSAQKSSLSVVPPAGLLLRLSICRLNQWRPPMPLSLAHQYGWRLMYTVPEGNGLQGEFCLCSFFSVL